MAATVIKVGLAEESGGVPIDAVENLLSRASSGEELAVFSSEGDIVYVNPNHEFEDIG